MSVVPRVRGTQKFGLLEGAFVTGFVAVIIASVSPYFGPSPYMVGEWSGTPMVMPAGMSQTAGEFARLNITSVDAAGNLSGTMKVAGISGPIAGTLNGHHISLTITSSGLAGPLLYGMSFEGVVRGARIDGTLIESGASQWNRQLLSYEVSLKRS